jgi:hypothetical protein
VSHAHTCTHDTTARWTVNARVGFWFTPRAELRRETLRLPDAKAGEHDRGVANSTPLSEMALHFGLAGMMPRKVIPVVGCPL